MQTKKIMPKAACEEKSSLQICVKETLQVCVKKTLQIGAKKTKGKETPRNHSSDGKAQASQQEAENGRRRTSEQRNLCESEQMHLSH
ncbi:hypothetical protein ACLKA7_011038 [Drosophila subpalustris]